MIFDQYGRDSFLHPELHFDVMDNGFEQSGFRRGQSTAPLDYLETFLNFWVWPAAHGAPFGGPVVSAIVDMDQDEVKGEKIPDKDGFKLPL